MKIYTKTILLLMPLLALSCGNQECASSSNPDPVQTHEHTPSTTYSKDEYGHYHACSCDKNVRFDFAPHTFAKNDDGFYVCSTCGYVKDTDKNEIYNIIKKAIKNTNEYKGSISLESSSIIDYGGAKERSITNASSDLTSGKFVEKAVSGEYDPSTETWTEKTELRKLEIEEDKYTYYTQDDKGVVTSNIADKTFAEYELSNPWETVGSFFYKGDNSFTQILLRVDSFAELNEDFAKIFSLNTSEVGNITLDVESKDNLYTLTLEGTAYQQNNNEGVKLGIVKGGYKFVFDKDKLREFTFGMESTIDSLASEEPMKMVDDSTIKFKYEFDNDLYTSVDFETKPAPTEPIVGRIDLIFEGGYHYSSSTSKPIGQKVVDAGTALGVNLYYDEALKNIVSEEEIFTCLTKTYYAEPVKDETRAFVIYQREINYKAPELFKKYLVDYTSKSVYFYQQHSVDAAYTVSSSLLPNDDEVTNLNAKVTLNGVAFDLSSPVINITKGNLYTLKTTQDGVAKPFDY
mgnify:CR=1 FL=1